MPFINLIKASIVTISLLVSVIFSHDQLIRTINTTNSPDRPPTYLPDAQAINFFTFGYQKPMADIFWFMTLNYFGEQYQKKASMPWFFHMCDVVSSLDSKADHVYEFCGTLLSWIAKEPENSNKILKKGIVAYPENWKYYYLIGFNEWYFLEDFQKAKESFKIASNLEGAPQLITNLTAKLTASHGTPEEAIAFLTASLNTSKDEYAKKALKKKLLEAYVSRDIKLLNASIQKFNLEKKSSPSSWHDLLNAGYLKELPMDPLGDIYVFDRETLSVQSKSLGLGLTFKGKTARTGMFKNEGW